MANNLTESTLAGMRSVRAKADAYFETARKLMPAYGEIPAGNEHARAFCRGESLAIFLREVAAGRTTSFAAALAKRVAREMIAKANHKRGKDYQTHIWEGAADADIDRAAEICK